MCDPNLFQNEGYILPSSNNHSGSCNSNNNNSSNGNLSAILDAQEEIDDISASIDFSTTSPFYVPPPFANSQQDQLDDLSSVLQQQLPLSDHVVNGFPPYRHSDLTGPQLGPLLPSIIEDSSISSPLGTAFLTPMANAAFIPRGTMNIGFCADTPGIFSTGALMSRELMQPRELDYQGDTAGFYYPDSKPQIFNPGDVQVKESNILS